MTEQHRMKHRVPNLIQNAEARDRFIMFQNLPSYTGRRGIDLGRGSKIDRPGMVAIFNAGLRDRRAPSQT